MRTPSEKNFRSVHPKQKFIKQKQENKRQSVERPVRTGGGYFYDPDKANKSPHYSPAFSTTSKKMSPKVERRLLGHYDDRRRICSTVHQGGQRPKKRRKAVKQRVRSSYRQVVISEPIISVQPLPRAPSVQDAECSPILFSESSKASLRSRSVQVTAQSPPPLRFEADCQVASSLFNQTSFKRTRHQLVATDPVHFYS